MNEEDIRHAIQIGYKNKQPQIYIERYRKIVEFHDGHNADRILECLIKDKIIKPKDSETDEA